MKLIQKPAERDALLMYVDEVLSSGIEGDLAECGVAAGGSANIIASVMDKHKTGKKLHLFDTFTGQPELRLPRETKAHEFNLEGCDCYSISEVEGNLLPYKEYIEFHKGLFSETLPRFDIPLCFIHADSDQYVSMKDTFLLSNRLLVPGGIIVVHDWISCWIGVMLAVNECLPDNGYELLKSVKGQLVCRRIRK